MSRLGGSIVILAGLIMTMAQGAFAQSLRIRSAVPKMQSSEESPWSASTSYSVLSDFADDRDPHSVTQSLTADLSYRLDPHWSVAAQAGVNYETVGGQIEKGEEQTYTETLNPSLGFELDYEDTFFKRHHYSLDVHGEPLLDEPSRLEGYTGLVGGGGELTLNFFNRLYSVEQTADASYLLNTYRYSLDNSANAEYFLTYRLKQSIRIFGRLRASYAFGIKTTHYTDDFDSYSYLNTFGLGMAWTHLSVGVSYQNGGYTDKGDVSLWYLDEYRRIARLSLAYAF